MNLIKQEKLPDKASAIFYQDNIFYHYPFIIVFNYNEISAKFATDDTIQNMI